MKNRFLSVILVLVMLIPTVVAIINYSMMQGGDAGTYNTVSVSLEDFHHNIYTFDREGENSDMINYFINAIKNAEVIKEVPGLIANGDYFFVTMNTTGNEHPSYQFYYTVNAAECYCKAYSGDKAYKLTSADAETFLASPYAASLFENGTAPTLTLSGSPVSPDSASWKFKNLSDEYIDFDSSAIVKEEIETVAIEGGLAMEFDLAPDSLTVNIVDKETKEVLYDGDYSKIYLDVQKKTNVSVEACAKWYEDTNRTYHGEEIFKFDAVLSAPASFNAAVQKIEIGQFICVTGDNVNDPSKITFTSEPDISYTPTFYPDEKTGKVMAFIPFTWNQTAGKYSLTFTYGGTTEVIEIELTEKQNAFKDKNITVPNSLVTDAGSDESHQKAINTLREVAKKASTTRYFEDSETLYYLNASTKDAYDLPGREVPVSTIYGYNVIINNDKNNSFRHTGIDYRLAEGSEVMANLGGEIVYADYLDYSGYTVCIDHGYGLKTWYAHLKNTSVNVGDVVKKGDAIGTAGSTGLTDITGFHVGMTIFDTPICTYAIWENGSNADGSKGIKLFAEEE